MSERSRVRGQTDRAERTSAPAQVSAGGAAGPVRPVFQRRGAAVPNTHIQPPPAVNNLTKACRGGLGVLLVKICH